MRWMTTGSVPCSASQVAGKVPFLGVEKETNSQCGNQLPGTGCQDGWNWQMASAYIDTLPTLIKEGNSSGIGTLRFAQQESTWSGRRGWGPWDVMAVGNVPTFRDIEDMDSEIPTGL
jgi:hypothetical protein